MADFFRGQIKTVQLFVCSSPNCPLLNGQKYHYQ